MSSRGLLPIVVVAYTEQRRPPLTTVLVVDDDAQVVSSIQRALFGASIDVVIASDNRDAARILGERRVNVLLVGAQHETVAGISLIAAAQRAPQRVTTILMMERASAREADEALDQGVAGILDKPFGDDDLQRALDRALNGGSFRGDLNGISLLDLFQVFNLSRRSLVVRVGGVPPARVWFENGEIVHAECGEVRGEAVLERLVDVRTGAIRTLPFSPAPRTVDRLFHSLLLDILRAQDESTRDAPLGEPLSALERGAVDEDLDRTLDSAVHEMARAELARPSSGEGDHVLAQAVLEPDIVEATDEAIQDELLWSARTVLPQRRLDPICRALTAELPFALAVALIDLASGKLLGMHNTADFSATFERFISLYVRELFRGPEVQHIERTVQGQRGFGESRGQIEQVALTSRYTHHLAKVIGAGDVAIIVVTPRRVSIQKTWSELDPLIAGVESNLA